MGSRHTIYYMGKEYPTIIGGGGGGFTHEIIRQTNEYITDNKTITLNLEEKYTTPYVVALNALPLTAWGGLVVQKDSTTAVYDKTNNTLTFDVYTNATQNYNIDWLVFEGTEESGSDGGGGSATHYHVFGIILDSHNGGTMTARGCADITIVGNLARVDFMITEKYNATHGDGYNWGINPALFTQIDPNIPLITPIASQGSWDTFGYNWDRMQYGTTFDISGDRWRPVRYYTTSGDKGAWSETVIPNQYRGTCYGTI